MVHAVKSHPGCPIACGYEPSATEGIPIFTGFRPKSGATGGLERVPCCCIPSTWLLWLFCSPLFPVAQKFCCEPFGSGHRRIGVASDPIGASAHGTPGCCALNKVLRRTNLISLQQITILHLQVAPGLPGVMPSAVAIELAAGRFDITEQMGDL